MNWMQLLASLVKSLAWPLASVVVALLLRDKLKDLLPRLKKGKVGPVELELYEEAVEIAAELDAVRPEPTDEPPPTPEPSPAESLRATSVALHRIAERERSMTPSERALELAGIDPRSAIAYRYRELNVTLRWVVADLAKFLGQEAPEGQMDSAWHRRAVELGVLRSEDRRALSWLKEVRNRSTHEADFEPSATTVIQYDQLAEQVERNLLERAILVVDGAEAARTAGG